MPSMKLLLDTNILLDAYQAREPFFHDWERLLLARHFGDVELWVSAKSFTDLFYVCTRQLSSHVVQQHIAKSLDLYYFCSVDGSDIRAAVEMDWDDFEDALIARSAEKIKADYIITRDAKGFEKSRIPTLTAGQLMDVLRDEFGFEYANFHTDENGEVVFTHMD